MPRLKDKTYKQPDIDDVLITDESDETFKIGQEFEDFAATTLKCKLCGSKEFNVSVDYCFTALKCTKCDWQICLHYG